MRNYLELCNDILVNGDDRMERTGTGTLSLFDAQLKYDMADGFPLVTVKRVPYRLVASEFIWMAQGRTDLRFLLEHNNNIWNDWPFKKYADDRGINVGTPGNVTYGREMERFKKRILEDPEFNEAYGDLGPVYGYQWRKWRNDTHLNRPEHVDQLQTIIERIKTDPTDRRLLVSAWNPADLHDMALPPCHYAFQFYVRGERFLDLKFHQRSADVFLGLPFDIASYATMLHVVAHLTGLTPGVLTADLGDVHIYKNHIEQVKDMLQRKPRELPRLIVWESLDSIDALTMKDLKLENYVPHPAIKGSVSV